METTILLTKMDLLYSFKGNEPGPLPERIRLESGFTITSLNRLSKEELLSYGFSGPFTKPKFDPISQELIWTGNSYIVKSLPLEEVERNKNEFIENQKRQLIDDINFTDFWDQFIKTKFNYKLRQEALQDKTLELLYLQFITKTGITESYDINYKILDLLTKFFTLIDFTEEEIESFYTLIEKFNINLFYTITINDIENFRNNYYYDYVTDSLIEKSNKKPYDSWVWNGEQWEPPVEYPSDGKIYIWDESIINWKTLYRY